MTIKVIKTKIKEFLSDKDERNLAFNILMAFIVKGMSLIISLFSIPLYIKYFSDNAVLGVWYTILSLLTWISICDLGLGNGLRNYFTVAYANDDINVGKKYIASTYGMLIIIIIPIAVFGAIGLYFVDFNNYFKISIDVISHNTLNLSIIILFLGVCLNFILKTINSILYAIQKASMNNIIALISSVVPLIYIWVAPNFGIENNFIFLSIVHVCAINIPLVIATVIVFSTVCKIYYSHIRDFEWQVAKKLLHMGISFLLAQLFFMFIMSTNEIFITRLFAADKVVEYSAYYRVFTLVGSLFMLALTPLWSKLTKDLAQKKYKKILKTNRVLYAISAFAFLCEIIIVFILQWIFNIWLKKDSFTVDYFKAGVFAIFGGLYIFNIVLTTVANSMGELNTQIIFYSVGAVLKIPIIQLLKLIVNDWISVIIYTCIILFIFCVFQFLWVKNRINKLLTSKNEC